MSSKYLRAFNGLLTELNLPCRAWVSVGFFVLQLTETVDAVNFLALVVKLREHTRDGDKCRYRRINTIAHDQWIMNSVSLALYYSVWEVDYQTQKVKVSICVYLTSELLVSLQLELLRTMNGPESHIPKNVLRQSLYVMLSQYYQMHSCEQYW